MLVTFTNAGSTQTFISQLYKQLDAGESVTASRTLEDLRGDLELNKKIIAGDITLTFATETGDDGGFGGGHVVGAYSNVGRPAASAFPIYSAIWNTDDQALNWTDGTNWRDAAGVIT